MACSLLLLLKVLRLALLGKNDLDSFTLSELILFFVG